MGCLYARSRGADHPRRNCTAGTRVSASPADDSVPRRLCGSLARRSECQTRRHPRTGHSVDHLPDWSRTCRSTRTRGDSDRTRPSCGGFEYAARSNTNTWLLFEATRSDQITVCYPSKTNAYSYWPNRPYGDLALVQQEGLSFFTILRMVTFSFWPATKSNLNVPLLRLTWWSTDHYFGRVHVERIGRGILPQGSSPLPF